MTFHETLLHSLLGSSILAVGLAILFYLVARSRPGGGLRFAPALLLCVIGVAANVLLDLATADGVQLLWPFRMRWFAADLLAGIDPWVLAILLAGLFLPALFRLVSEEIGERKKRKGPSKMAIAALIVVVLYIGFRFEMRATAIRDLTSVDYHGRTPIVASAFPDPSSPFAWRGVVDTTNTIEDLSLTVGPAGIFDPDTSLTHFKPVTDPALEAARRAPLARKFLAYARFPLASLETLANGFRITIRDVRFPSDADTASNLIAEIDLDAHYNLQEQKIRFAGDNSPAPQ